MSVRREIIVSGVKRYHHIPPRSIPPIIARIVRGNIIPKKINEKIPIVSNISNLPQVSKCDSFSIVFICPRHYHFKVW